MVYDSRKRKECARNLELRWLCGIIPNYHSISDFRKQNPSGLKNLFKLFVSFLKDDYLLGKPLLSMVQKRAHNSKKANFNQKRLIDI
jgi:transposase